MEVYSPHDDPFIEISLKDYPNEKEVVSESNEVMSVSEVAGRKGCSWVSQKGFVSEGLNKTRRNCCCAR